MPIDRRLYDPHPDDLFVHRSRGTTTLYRNAFPKESFIPFGRLVTFEGIDGAGKSTVAREVYRALCDAGDEVILTSEPYDRDAWAAADPTWTANDFIRDRQRHFRERVRPAMAGGQTVLCDRGAASTFAYQRVPWRTAAAGLEPDVIFIVDTPLETCFQRLEARGEIFNKELLRAAQDRYFRLSGTSSLVKYISDGEEAIDFLKKIWG